MFTIIKLLGISRSTFKISNNLGRDHRTVKKYAQHQDFRRRRSDEGKLKVVCNVLLQKLSEKYLISLHPQLYKLCNF